MKFYSFDIRIGKKEVMDINGLTDRIMTREEVVEKYYKSKSYQVIRLDATKRFCCFSSQNIVAHYLKNNFNFKKQNKDDSWYYFCCSVGVPDFLVYKLKDKKIIELFFVEVKNMQGGIKFNQLNWFYRTNAPVKILYVDFEVEKNVF